MSDFTHNWFWPQWTMAIFMLLALMISTARHGQERLETHGERKGKPETYSGFTAFIRFGLWVFILTCGGFFR